jgi:pSer/pThr/pTyr-binding forkhead associated (FHA) protein
VCVDDPLISRRHLRLTVTEMAVIVEDLRSANGVYINGVRLHRPRPLCEGDRLLIGGTELSLFPGEPELRSSGFHEAPTATGLADPSLVALSEGRPTATERPIREADLDEAVQVRAEAVVTARASAFDVLGRLADRMLAMGRGKQAEEVLRDHMQGVISGARAGLSMPETVRENAIHYALSLAEVTSKGGWGDYAIEIHLHARVLMSEQNVERLLASLRPDQLEPALARNYLATVSSILDLADDAHRRAFNRLEDALQYAF